MEQSKRKSNFELLRILAMIMIVAHHCCLYSNFQRETLINNAVLDFLIIGGKIGVAVFVLISGYFGISSEFRLKKLIKLLVQVLFYSLSFGIIHILLTGNISLKELIKMVFPITCSSYWFMTSYCILYVLTPYINKLFRSLNKRELINLLAIIGVLSCGIFATFSVRRGVNDLFIFVFLYMAGGYINVYCMQKKYKYTLLIAIISYFSIFAMQILAELTDLFPVNYFIELSSLPVIICAMSLVLYFKNIKFQSNFVNFFSRSTLGVYLIHENMYVREFLWEKVTKGTSLINNSIFAIYVILSIILVYLICAVIDLIRIHTVEKCTLQFIYNICDKLKCKLKKYTERVKL